jgi:tetratricopeptide (TPR) repeat protein
VPDPLATVAQLPQLAPSAPASGADRYELLDELARGGMGVVYRARDRLLNRVVGLKTLISTEPDEPIVQRFCAEAHITGQLQHPNIPPVHDLGTLPDGRPFLAMKLVNGRTLAAILADPARPADFDPLVALEFVCQAMGYAHGERVIHRDLKPSNVMVGAHGEVQVMDWGIARVGEQPAPAAPVSGAADTIAARAGESTVPQGAPRPGAPPDSATPLEVTQPGVAMGTPAYMPPEQARGAWHEVDERADVFALGGLLAVILSGAPPYTGSSVAAVLARAEVGDLGECFARLDACGGDPELIALAKRCLAVKRDARPANGAAVAAAIAAHRAGARARLAAAEADRAATAIRAEEAERRAAAERDAARAAEGRAEEAARRAEEAARRAEAEAARADEQKRRRRAQLALAGALALLLAAGGGFVWWSGERKAAEAKLEGERDAEARSKSEQARQSIDANLRLATDLRKQSRFAPAADALAAAERGADGGAPERRAEVRAARAALELARELDAIRYRKWRYVPTPGGVGDFDTARAPGEYRAALRARGLDPTAGAPAEAAARCAASPARAEIVAALDDWALSEPDPAVRDRVLDVARRADPTGLAAELRDPKVRGERGLLRDFAARAVRDGAPPGTGVVLADLLARTGEDPGAFLVAFRAKYPDDFELAFYVGQLRANSPRRVETLSALEAARALRPEVAAVWNNLGVALERAGDPAAAIAALRRASELDPADAKVHSNRAIALRAAGDADGALAACRRAIEMAPTFASAYVNLGNTLTDLRRYAEARAAHTAALRVSPEMVPALIGLGSAYSAAGAHARARAVYEEALRIDPQSALAHVGIGNTRLRQEQPVLAVSSFERAVALDPRNPVTYSSLGVALQRVGKLDAAATAQRAALLLDPDFAAAHTNLGSVLVAQKQFEAALAALNRAVELDPNDAVALAHLGRLDYLAGDRNDALKWLDRALKSDPGYALAHAHRGEVLLANKQFPEARKALERAIELDRRCAPAYKHLGFALAQSGDPAGAARAFDAAIRLDPNDATSRISRGFSHFQQREPERVLALGREVVAIDPKIGDGHGLIGLALLQTGDLPGARAAFAEATRLDSKWAEALAKLPPLPVAPPPRAK